MPDTPRPEAEPEFDLIAHLDDVLDGIGLSRDDAVAAVEVTGEDPIMKSVARLGASIGVPLLAVGTGVATIAKQRGGESQTLALDLNKAVHSLSPFMTGWTKLNGYLPNLGEVTLTEGGSEVMMGERLISPLMFDMYQARGGRWVVPTCPFPHQRDAFLQLLGVPHDKAAVTAAIAGWDAFELEEACAEKNIALCVVRTEEEFRAHPQGRAVLTEPLITIEKIADSDPEPFTLADVPLAGLRVLQDTKVIAGMVVGRTLAEHGADVLHVNGPHEYEQDINWAEVGLGMRSARVDIKEPAGAEVFRRHLGEADVFIENRRGSAMERAGFGPKDAAALRPGVVYCSLNAYGHTGPWAERAGFDQEGLAFTGYMVKEGSEEQPQFPPTGILNDFIMGYFAAAGVLAALVRRATEGGSYHVKLSLARTSAWYPTLGLLDKESIDFDGAPHRLAAPELMTADTPLGELVHLAPPVQYSRTPSSYPEPVLIPRGSSKPEWLPR
ncbi:CoA transferase [Kitasatospora acidiphila]|nr:CoA transferase [Kitasatospora acidiphila]